MYYVDGRFFWCRTATPAACMCCGSRARKPRVRVLLRNERAGARVGGGGRAVGGNRATQCQVPQEELAMAIAASLADGDAVHDQQEEDVAMPEAVPATSRSSAR